MASQTGDDEWSSNSTSTAAQPDDPGCDRFSSPTYSESAVAVIGMSCKFAGADSLEQFWDILESGSNQCRDLPNDRFPDWRFERRAYPKNFKANTINDVDAFDHKFFKIASREATFMDPQQRLALQGTYQALESAGYFERDASQRELDMGCYIATCMNEYHENVACHPPSAFSLTGSIRPFISGKVSHYFGWTGPAMIFDTACAASGTAIHQACRAVATGECNSALAGATNIFVSPDTFQNLAAGHFINTTGASKSFDAAADGYCRGEGVAFVVLKKLSAALQDGDPIRGVIAATAVGQNANETSITIPHGPSQMSLYRKALRLASLNAQDISYVEAHGTGTPVGDPIEAESIRGVFGDANYPRQRAKTYLGSLKSNIGHTEASSGISGLIKVLLMMQKGLIPRQALFNNLNPAIPPLEVDNIEIPTTNVPWTSKWKAACVNNYGASGTNAVMIVTQPPSVTQSIHRVPIDTYPISVTAFSASSLASYCSALLDFINRSAKKDLIQDISYHLSRRKNLDLAYSIHATVSSLQELKDFLTSAVAKQHSMNADKKQPVVLFFGGQTGNTASIPRVIYDSSAILRKHLDDCDAIVQSLGARSIFPAIFGPGSHDDVVLLHSMLFSIQYANAMAWLDCGLQPVRLIGHSFGQITAICVSGVLSLYDSLRLIITRARLVAELWGKDVGSMIAIEADLDRVSTLLTQHPDLNLEIACSNGPQSFVLAGTIRSVDALEDLLKSSLESFRWKRLQVTNAFHSALTEPLISPLRNVAVQLNYQQPKIAIETCSKYKTWDSVTPDLVASHTREPVYFHQAVERISEQFGSCTWIEAGSGSGTPMLRRALGARISTHSIKSMKLDSFSSVAPLAEVTKDLWNLGVEVQFWPFHKTQRHQYEALNLPPYQFDKSRHWLEWKGSVTPPIEIPKPAQEETAFIRLVQKTKHGGEFQINTQCEEWKTLCSEHHVLNVPICSVSGLLELISKAIDRLQHTPRQKVNTYHIQQLLVQSLIPAEFEQWLYLTVSVKSPQSWAFMISETPNSSHQYASGTLIASSGVSESDFARVQRLLDTKHIKSISNDAEADSVKGKAVYKSVADLFRVPKSEQNIKEVSARDNEAIGYLTQISHGPLMAVEKFIEVPLLCLNSLRDRQDDEMYIFTRLGDAKSRYFLDSTSDETASWAVYVKFFGSEDTATTCDIFVFDVQSEQLSTIILDVTFVKTKIESLRHTLGSPLTCTQPNVDHLDLPEARGLVEPSGPQTPDPVSAFDDRMSNQSDNLPDLAQALFDLLVRVADVEPAMLRKDTLIADLGIDSLMGMEVTEEINNFFSVKIGIADAAAALDVDSLCKLIATQTRGFSHDSGTGSRSPSVVLDSAESSTRPSTTAASETDLSSDGGFEKTNSSLPPSCSHGEPSAVLQAFSMMYEEFDGFAQKTGCDDFWSQVYPSQAQLIVAYITEAFTKLGCDLSAIEVGEKIPKISRISESPRHEKLTARLMHALCDDGLVSQTKNDWIRTSKAVSTRQSSSHRYDQILTDFPQFASEHKLLHTIGSRLDQCLSGQVNPLHLLFGSPEKRQLMADQYLTAPFQSTASQQLASFINHRFHTHPPHTPLRILELGGGTCGTSIHTLNAFAALNISVTYTFTDISPSFVSSARSKLRQYDFVTFRTLDVTADPPSDLLGFYDMIIATNVIHATPDVCQSVRHARRMLKPGGDSVLALVEYTTPLYLLDVVFGQLDGWWAFEDGRDHAIMDEMAWKKTLERAGFATVRCSAGVSPESRVLSVIVAC